MRYQSTGGHAKELRLQLHFCFVHALCITVTESSCILISTPDAHADSLHNISGPLQSGPGQSEYCNTDDLLLAMAAALCLHACVIKSLRQRSLPHVH